MPRAIQTAAILAPLWPEVRFEQQCSLCERHPGEVDGLTWAEYSRQSGRSSLPGDDPDRRLSPDGESWIEFLDRAADALDEVAARHPGELVVIAAHGGIIDSSMIRYLPIESHGSNTRLHPEHASLTEWQHTGAKWRLVRYSDAAHLYEPDVAAAQDATPASPLRSPTPEWVLADRRRVATQQA